LGEAPEPDGLAVVAHPDPVAISERGFQHGAQTVDVGGQLDRGMDDGTSEDAS
jgi:hypothetical protein